MKSIIVDFISGVEKDAVTTSGWNLPQYYLKLTPVPNTSLNFGRLLYLQQSLSVYRADGGCSPAS